MQISIKRQITEEKKCLNAVFALVFYVKRPFGIFCVCHPKRQVCAENEYSYCCVTMEKGGKARRNTLKTVFVFLSAIANGNSQAGQKSDGTTYCCDAFLSMYIFKKI